MTDDYYLNSAWQAHSIEAAESLVYRRSLEELEEDDENSEGWKPITNGLPEPSGTIISILAMILLQDGISALQQESSHGLNEIKCNIVIGFPVDKK